MPNSLAPAEPTVRRFEADVASRDGRRVVLDETYFYAESGGQPADRGTLAGEQVVDVQSGDGDVVHTLAEEPDVEAGETVTGVVDDDFRTYCMRAHSASHVLYGAGRKVLDDLGYGGFDIGEEKVRVDFTTSTDIDDDVLVDLERLVNRAVWESRDVSWEEVPVETAHEREEVAFNTKTEEGVMADADTVRVVTVDGWDWAACGGTHVSNTVEIGPVEVLGRSNPGEGLTRVEFAVGPTAVDRRGTVHGETLRAARELGVGVEDVGDAVASLREDRDALESERNALLEEVITGRLRAAPSVERDGVTWLVDVVDDFGPNEVGEAAKTVARDDGVVVAAVGSERPFVVVATGGTGVDAGDVVTRLTDEFGGGGGGGPPFAQGGGLDADPDDVVAALRDGV